MQKSWLVLKNDEKDRASLLNNKCYVSEKKKHHEIPNFWKPYILLKSNFNGYCIKFMHDMHGLLIE